MRTAPLASDYDNPNFHQCVQGTSDLVAWAEYQLGSIPVHWPD